MKKTVIAICVILSACSKKDGTTTNTTPTTTTTNPPATTDKTVVVRKMFDAFNSHDWDAMAKCYVDSAEFLDPSFGKKYIKQSHQQLIKKYADLQKSAPDINDQLLGVYAFEDKVIAEFVSSGTSGGQKWTLPICTVFTVKDEKITRDATYYDN